MDFISIPNSVRPSNAPTPNLAEPSPAVSQVVTPSFSSIAAGPSSSYAATNTQGTASYSNDNLSNKDGLLLKMEEELKRSGEAVESLQQMDLWSLVLDLITRVQHGTVTAKTVDNEAGTIRVKIAKAKQALRQISGLDVSVGEREEEIIRLQEAIEKKKDLLVRFQAVMGGATLPEPATNTTVNKQEESIEQDLKKQEEAADIIENTNEIDVFMPDFSFSNTNPTTNSTSAPEVDIADLDFEMPNQQNNDLFNNFSFDNFEM